MMWRPATERPPEGELVLFASAGSFYPGEFVVTGDPEHDFYWRHHGSSGTWESKHNEPDWWMPIPPLPGAPA